MPTLTQVSAEHRERLMSHVDELPRLADRIGTVPWDELRHAVAEEHVFLTTTLIPHMEAVESGIHRELDRLLSCRLAMEPMEREHADVRRLVGRMGELAGEETDAPRHDLELNRVLIKLYSILKVHLREESLYTPILERNLQPDELEALVKSLDHATRAGL